ncbi:hypothetical protein [Streptomyces sp. NPDC029003]|uniref:hypothetical protein n=1 Tax=Streptomyces sp. NPDC029003 TaxID=3155125 RepID=UPI0033C4C246
MSARVYGPGRYRWTLAAEFRSEVPASVAGHGVIELTEPESALAVCARLVRELGGPDLAGLDSTTAFTIEPFDANAARTYRY